MVRQRFSDWVGQRENALARTSPTDIQGLRTLLHSLRSHAPGPWSANLMELARHFTSAIYIAVNTLATHASRSTFHCYERTTDPSIPNGEVQLPWDDPIHEQFEEPNGEDTLADVLYQVTQQLSLTGQSLAWAVPSGEFYSLPTANCWPMPPGTYGTHQYPRGAYRVIPYAFGLTSAPTYQTAAGAVIPAEQVVRLKNHHPYLRYDGYAVLTAIGRQADTLEAIDTSRSATMRQGAEQSLQLKSANPMSQDPDAPTLQLLRTQLELLYAGPENAGKILIPPAGWEFSQVSTAPKDMAWQEGFTQLLDFVLAGFSVPRSVACMQDSSSYATLYASLRAFGYFSLGPLVARIEARWNKDIIRPRHGRQFGIRLKPPEFKDEQLEVNQLSNDLKAGAIKIKEYRARRGWDAIDEPWTEERATANYSPQGAPGGDEEQDPMAALLGGGDGGKDNVPESSGPRINDPHADNARPNVQKRLEYVLERMKTNGHAHPIKN